MEQSPDRPSEEPSKSAKGINLIIGIFLLVTGAFSVMFHFILFPLIGLFVGVPLLVVGAIFLVIHRQRGRS